MKTLTAVTPFGTFTRKTSTEYRFVALAEQRDHPETGVSLAGNRKGDPELTTSRERTYRVEPFNPNSEMRTYTCYFHFARYHAVWSKTREGAAKNAENYPYDHVRLVGVYPVQAS